MRPCRAFLLVLLLGLAQAAAAALTVEGVASPAWVERAGGAREPLAAGMSLHNSDRVMTGAGARALLRLADGSGIKLGENATLALDGLGESRRDGASRLVTASLDVLRGAFRFTTGLFGRRGARDVSIRVATVTTGVRGTDLWGKSDERRDLVCLIEGRIEVQRGTDAPVTLADPLDFYVAPKDGSAPTKAKVDPQQLQQWATETELDAVAGVARRGGRHWVAVSAPDTQADALDEYDRLRRAGFPAAILPASTDGVTVYRVRVPGIRTERDALAVARKLRDLGFAAATAAR